MEDAKEWRDKRDDELDQTVEEYWLKEDKGARTGFVQDESGDWELLNDGTYTNINTGEVVCQKKTEKERNGHEKQQK